MDLLAQAKAWIKAQYWSRRDHVLSSVGAADSGRPVVLNSVGKLNSSIIGANMTGDGTIATSGFTLTVPATGTAALLGTAQTFSAVNTFNTTVSVKYLNSPDVVIANDGIHLFNSSLAVVLIIDRTGAIAGLYLLRGGALAVVELLDSGPSFTSTQDNAGTWNVYYESPDYKLQNKTGISRTVHVYEFV
jgi:hypothetical protein